MKKMNVCSGPTYQLQVTTSLQVGVCNIYIGKRMTSWWF